MAKRYKDKSTKGISDSLSLKINPIEIINDSELAKSKKRLEEINAEINRIRGETDKLLPEAATDEQAVNLLKMEEAETAKLIEEQTQLTAAVSEYEAKQKEITAEKQALKKQADATKDAAKATKEANNQLAAFDEKNMLTSNNASSAGTSDSTAGAATLELPDVSKEFDKTCNKIKDAIKKIITGTVRICEPTMNRHILLIGLTD